MIKGLERFVSFVELIKPFYICVLSAFTLIMIGVMIYYSYLAKVNIILGWFSFLFCYVIYLTYRFIRSWMTIRILKESNNILIKENVKLLEDENDIYSK